jgi:hypothetical protein
MKGPDAKAGRPSAARRGARPRDRRFWERYPARGPGATLTWLEGASERMIRGELLNIGGEGASFVSEALPPSGVALGLRLEPGGRWGGRIDPVECRVVRTADHPSGRKIAHIRFAGPCPIEIFDLAVRRVE